MTTFDILTGTEYDQLVACFHGNVQTLFITLGSFWKIATVMVNYPKITIGFSFCIQVACFPGNVRSLFPTIDSFWKIIVVVVQYPKRLIEDLNNVISVTVTTLHCHCNENNTAGHSLDEILVKIISSKWAF